MQLQEGQVIHQRTCKCSHCKSIATYYWTQDLKQKALAITGGKKNGGEEISIAKEDSKNYNNIIILTLVHFKTVMLPSSLPHPQANAIYQKSRHHYLVKFASGTLQVF